MTKQKFINQWLRRFAPELSKKQFVQYVKDQYIWHVFSFNLIPAESLLTGAEARQAFDKAEKADCICCDLFGGNGVMDSLPSDCDTAAKIGAQMKEFYVISGDLSWTYIKTHENMQYFFRK